MAALARHQAHGQRRGVKALEHTDEAAGFPAFVERLTQALATWGASRLAGLVNNAGAGAHASFAETTPAQFDAMLAIPLTGPFFLTRALLPLLACPQSTAIRDPAGCELPALGLLGRNGCRAGSGP